MLFRSPHVHLLHLPTGAGKNRLRELTERKELDAFVCNTASFFFRNEVKVGVVVSKMIIEEVNTLLEGMAVTTNHYNAVGVNTMKQVRLVARVISAHPSVTAIQAKHFARTGELVEEVKYRVGTGLNAGWKFSHPGLQEASDDIMSSDTIQGFGRQRAGMRQDEQLVQVLIVSLCNKAR